MLYSKKYRLIPAVSPPPPPSITVQTVEEAMEKNRDKVLGDILEDNSLGSGEKMAAYEDAFVKRINSVKIPRAEGAGEQEPGERMSEAKERAENN